MINSVMDKKDLENIISILDENREELIRSLSVIRVWLTVDVVMFLSSALAVGYGVITETQPEIVLFTIFSGIYFTFSMTNNIDTKKFTVDELVNLNEEIDELEDAWRNS